MKEVLRSNNIIELSWAKDVLYQAGIEAVILDTHTAVMEGSISAIEQRLVVPEKDLSKAMRELSQAKAELE